MFGGVFNSETPFWQGVARIADIVLLNLYFVLTAWPIVTAGASLAALYDCSWRLQDDRGGGTTKMYFRSFAANFGRATAIWAVVGPVGIALGCAWIFLPIAELTVIKTVLTLAYLLVLPYFNRADGGHRNVPAGTPGAAVAWGRGHDRLRHDTPTEQDHSALALDAPNR